MILLVDDNRMTGRVMEANLERAGLKSQCVDDAEAALAALDTSPEICVVVTDLSMPGMDGLAFMDAVRERPELSALPIIVASASVDVETVKAAGLRGARRVFVKPIPEEALVREVQAAINEADRLALRDERQTLKQLGLDAAQYSEILRDLAGSLRGAIPKLEALASADPPEDGAGHSEVRAEVRNIAETAGAVAHGKFMSTLEHLKDLGRNPSPSDWCRVALRDLRMLSIEVEARIAERAAEAEAAETPPEGSAPESAARTDEGAAAHEESGETAKSADEAQGEDLPKTADAAG